MQCIFVNANVMQCDRDVYIQLINGLYIVVGCTVCLGVTMAIPLASIIIGEYFSAVPEHLPIRQHVMMFTSLVKKERKKSCKATINLMRSL